MTQTLGLAPGGLSAMQLTHTGPRIQLLLVATQHSISPAGLVGGHPAHKRRHAPLGKHQEEANHHVQFTPDTSVQAVAEGGCWDQRCKRSGWYVWPGLTHTQHPRPPHQKQEEGHA